MSKIVFFYKSSMLKDCDFSKNCLNSCVFFSYDVNTQKCLCTILCFMRTVYVSVMNYVVSFFAVAKEKIHKLWLFI